MTSGERLGAFAGTTRLLIARLSLGSSVGCNTSGIPQYSHWNQQLISITSGYQVMPHTHETIPVKYLLTT
jgi:hypothetical protein